MTARVDRYYITANTSGTKPVILTMRGTFEIPAGLKDPVNLETQRDALTLLRHLQYHPPGNISDMAVRSTKTRINVEKDPVITLPDPPINQQTNPGDNLDAVLREIWEMVSAGLVASWAWGVPAIRNGFQNLRRGIGKFWQWFCGL